MKKLLMITTIFFILLITLTPAMGAETITGKLSGYGKDFIVVNGRTIELCDDYKISDPIDAEEETGTDGLGAVETVTVTLKNTCAIEIKAIVVRN
ncbi:MAG TPA: hypothetical protein ENI58_00245 [Nitrospirae bacterium]|nr:hypothetical protein [Nitrospirota bacterium]